MDASQIKRKISAIEHGLDGQLSGLEHSRRALASTHAQQVNDLQEAATSLCQTLARQDPDSFTDKLLPAFKKAHSSSQALIAKDQARIRALDEEILPAANVALSSQSDLFFQAKRALEESQGLYDQALLKAQEELLQSNPEAADLSASLHAGRARSDRLSQILKEMKSQYQDLENRLQADPVFCYFDTRAFRGNTLTRAIDRMLSGWCNYPAQARMRQAAQDQIRMWEEYDQQLDAQLQQLGKRLDAIMAGAFELAAVKSAAKDLRAAKSGFDGASSKMDDAREHLTELVAERERLEDGTSTNTMVAIDQLIAQIATLSVDDLRRLAASTTTQEDDMLVEQLASLGHRDSSGLIGETERQLQKIEKQIKDVRKRRGDIDKITNAIRSKNLLSSRSRFRSPEHIDQALERMSEGQLSVAHALALIASNHYLKPVPPPPPVYKSSSRSSSSGGFGTGGGFGGGGFSSGGGFGGGGFKSGGGF